jgi:hypothetical protein
MPFEALRKDMATVFQSTNNLITNILAKNLENHFQKAGAILEITSKLPQVRNVPFAHLLNQTLRTEHGIPQGIGNIFFKVSINLEEQVAEIEFCGITQQKCVTMTSTGKGKLKEAQRFLE